ncbi:MAG: hypothetical protein MZW92_78280 [Comamonadaceae bacterium]|nr:hypothetical protein [Comamonadaceae bacterium]
MIGVAGVFAYNKWQERKYRRQTERAFRRDHADVLLEPKAPAPLDLPPAGARRRRDERIEPVDLSLRRRRPRSSRSGGRGAGGRARGAAGARGRRTAVIRFEAAEPISAQQFVAGVGRTAVRRRQAGALARAGTTAATCGSSCSATARSAAASGASRCNSPTGAGPLAERRSCSAFCGGVQQLADRLHGA